MKKKTVEEEIDGFEVRVEYKDGELNRVEVFEGGVLGKVRDSSVVHSQHLEVVKKLLEEGLPE